jgi:hypothetical protein
LKFSAITEVVDEHSVVAAEEGRLVLECPGSRLSPHVVFLFMSTTAMTESARIEISPLPFLKAGIWSAREPPIRTEYPLGFSTTGNGVASLAQILFVAE